MSANKIITIIIGTTTRQPCTEANKNKTKTEKATGGKSDRFMNYPVIRKIIQLLSSLYVISRKNLLYQTI